MCAWFSVSKDLREMVKMRAVLTVELVAFILSVCSERKTEGLNLTFKMSGHGMKVRRTLIQHLKKSFFFFFAARENIEWKPDPLPDCTGSWIVKKSYFQAPANLLFKTQGLTREEVGSWNIGPGRLRDSLLPEEVSSSLGDHINASAELDASKYVHLPQNWPSFVASKPLTVFKTNHGLTEKYCTVSDFYLNWIFNKTTTEIDLYVQLEIRRTCLEMSVE